MSEPRKENRSAAAPVLAAVLCLAIPLGAYVAGYFWLGEYSEGLTFSVCGPPIGEPQPMIVRHYPSAWLVKAFVPAAYVETKLRGTEVAVFPQ